MKPDQSDTFDCFCASIEAYIAFVYPLRVFHTQVFGAVELMNGRDATHTGW